MNDDRSVSRDVRVVQARPGYDEPHTVWTEPEVISADRVVERRRTVTTPSMVLSLVGGAALVILGIVAMMRGDFSNTWTDPVTVAGITQTPLLGVIEIGAGVVLMLVALGSAASRVAVGIILAIAGAVLWVANGDLRADVGAEWWFGAIIAIGGGLIAVLALAEGDRFASRRRVDRVVERVDV